MLLISTQVLAELSNTLKRKFKLSWLEVESTLLEVSSGFNIYVNTPATIAHACQIAEKYMFSFYDSLIIFVKGIVFFHKFYLTTYSWRLRGLAREKNVHAKPPR